MKELENFPEELKKIPNWLFHINKQPMTWDPVKKILRPASINEPKDWLTFEKLKELKPFIEEKYRNSESPPGIGFVFKPELGFVFIDFDHVMDDQGNVNPEVEQIIEKINSYTEISQSGQGIHIYVRTHIPEYAKGYAKRMEREYGNLEIYEDKFAVITGIVFKQFDKIREIEFFELFEILGIEINGETETEKGNISELSQEKIDQLYAILDQYAIEGYRNAVQLTLSVLMKNAGLSKEYVDQFFIDYVKSRGTDGKMSEAEIIKSITKLNDYIFKRDYQGIAPKGALPISVQNLKNIIWKGFKKEKTEEKKNENEFLTDGKLDREKLIEHIIESFSRIISFDKTIYVWTGDRYSDQGRDLIGKFIQALIPDLSSRSINDILESVYFHTFKTDDEVKKMELPNRFIPVKNGLIDWKERKLYPHNPVYFYKQRLNVEYKEGVFPEKFVEYLLSRFEGNYENMFKLLEAFGLMHLRDNKYQLIPVNLGLSKDSDNPDLTSGEEGKTLTWREIIARKYLGEGLWTDIDPNVLIERDTEWITLDGKWLHIMSIDEAKRKEGFSGLIEKLRDPGFTKPVKYSKFQKNIENTALHIIIGNKLPPSKDRTKAFYRSIKQFIEWRRPIGEDWKYVDLIDEKEKSGMLNLAVSFLNLIELREKVYGTETLDKVVQKYNKFSDPLIPFLQSIFEKDQDSELEEFEVREYINQMMEEADFVLPTALTKTTVTKALKEAFGINTKRSSKIENGNKISFTYYIGIKKREMEAQKHEEKNLSNRSDDVLFLNAVRDYLSSFGNFSYSFTQLNHFLFPVVYEIVHSYIYRYRKGRIKLSSRVLEFCDRLKTLEKTDSASNFLNTLLTLLDEIIEKLKKEESKEEDSEEEIKKEDILLTDKTRFFKVDQYYEPEKMSDWGIKVLDHFNYNGSNYYAIDDNYEIKGSGAFEYSNFILRAEKEGGKIPKEKFLKIKEEFLKGKRGNKNGECGK